MSHALAAKAGSLASIRRSNARSAATIAARKPSRMPPTPPSNSAAASRTSGRTSGHSDHSRRTSRVFAARGPGTQRWPRWGLWRLAAPSRWEMRPLGALLRLGCRAQRECQTPGALRDLARGAGRRDCESLEMAFAVDQALAARGELHLQRGRGAGRDVVPRAAELEDDVQ